MKEFKVLRAKGCLVGAACGDYLGVPVEFEHNPEKIIEFFGSETVHPIPDTGSRDPRKIPGYYSDDTCMAICLAESLINNGFDVKDQFRRYKEWMNHGYATPDGGHEFGIGIRTMRVLLNADINNLPTELKHDEDFGSNGALMRIAPVAIKYTHAPNLFDYVLKASIITHNNRDSVWACFALCQFIAWALQGLDRRDFVSKLLFEYEVKLPVNVKKILGGDFVSYTPYSVPNSGYVMDTLNIALGSFFSSDDFAKAVSKSIISGGDTDTQAAVTGALAGAYWGEASIPVRWKTTLLRHGYISDLAVKLLET